MSTALFIVLAAWLIIVHWRIAFLKKEVASLEGWKEMLNDSIDELVDEKYDAMEELEREKETNRILSFLLTNP